MRRCGQLIQILRYRLADEAVIRVDLLTTACTFRDLLQSYEFCRQLENSVIVENSFRSLSES
jgi:hypothetical protein